MDSPPERVQPEHSVPSSSHPKEREQLLVKTEDVVILLLSGICSLPLGRAGGESDSIMKKSPIDITPFLRVLIRLEGGVQLSENKSLMEQFEDNRERIKARKALYYQQNKERIAAQQKAYREANKERRNEWQRERRHNALAAAADALPIMA